jgi:hypothetical protein
VQGIPAQTGRFQSPSFLSRVAVERVCASFQGGQQKSALRCGFGYDCVKNAHSMAIFVSVFTKYRTECILCGSLFKTSDF